MNKKTVTVLLRIVAAIALLYLFLTSISMMSGAFKLFGKGFADQLLKSCSNPFTGLFIGVLATSLIQSSSTTTSLVVGLAGSGVLPLDFCIPIIMGANVGTSITNTIVSMTFMTRQADFKRAFAAATVHDFFNLLSVLVFFPIELKFHLIRRIAVGLTDVFQHSGGVKFTSPLKAVIKPVVKGFQQLLTDSIGLPKTTAGVIELIVAIVILIASLAFLVKVLRQLVISKAETAVDKYTDDDKGSILKDGAALFFGVAITVAVQSSSVTTSLIVPLVAAGILTLKRCYPITLGANIGTTCTALLASLATVKSENGAETAAAVGVMAAFAHLTFNLLGIAVFYPLKAIPIKLATRFSELASRSRKWVFIYILGVFFLLPLLTIFLTRNIEWVQNSDEAGGSQNPPAVIEE